MNDRIKAVVRAAVAWRRDLIFATLVEDPAWSGEDSVMRQLCLAAKALTPQDLADCGVEVGE